MNFFNSLGSPQKIVAPMVDHSGLAYRMMCRKYGAELVYTQMFHARMFVESEEYRKTNFQTCLNDRPLVIQFCGNDPQILLQAAKLVEDCCDAVDINLGCPQGIAKRGRYGAFLMEELDLLSNIVRTMSQGLKIPVTCKTRIYKDFNRTIRLCETLTNAGASLLTIHGRTREEKKQLIGEADWNTLRRIKLHYADKGIPIISNGGIGTMGDFYSCLEFTGVDGIMVSEAILEDPAFFSRPIPPISYTNQMKYPLIDTPINFQPHPTVSLTSPTQYELAMEYLDFCHLYPPPHHRTIRSHLMKFLYRYFSKHPDIRNKLGDANTLEEYESICKELGVILSQHDDSEYDDIWYSRHQREKEKEETKTPTKTDKLKFESFFERFMNEKNENNECGDNDCDGGLFSGTGMFNDTPVDDTNVESNSKV